VCVYIAAMETIMVHSGIICIDAKATGTATSTTTTTTTTTAATFGNDPYPINVDEDDNDDDSGDDDDDTNEIDIEIGMNYGYGDTLLRLHISVIDDNDNNNENGNPSHKLLNHIDHDNQHPKRPLNSNDENVNVEWSVTVFELPPAQYIDDSGVVADTDIDSYSYSYPPIKRLVDVAPFVESRRVTFAQWYNATTPTTTATTTATTAATTTVNANATTYTDGEDEDVKAEAETNAMHQVKVRPARYAVQNYFIPRSRSRSRSSSHSRSSGGSPRQSQIFIASLVKTVHHNRENHRDNNYPDDSNSNSKLSDGRRITTEVVARQSYRYPVEEVRPIYIHLQYVNTNINTNMDRRNDDNDANDDSDFNMNLDMDVKEDNRFEYFNTSSAMPSSKTEHVPKSTSFVKKIETSQYRHRHVNEHELKRDDKYKGTAPSRYSTWSFGFTLLLAVILVSVSVRSIQCQHVSNISTRAYSKIGGWVFNYLNHLRDQIGNGGAAQICLRLFDHCHLSRQRIRDRIVGGMDCCRYAIASIKSQWMRTVARTQHRFLSYVNLLRDRIGGGGGGSGGGIRYRCAIVKTYCMDCWKCSSCWNWKWNWDWLNRVPMVEGVEIHDEHEYEDDERNSYYVGVGDGVGDVVSDSINARIVSPVLLPVKSSASAGASASVSTNVHSRPCYRHLSEQDGTGTGTGTGIGIGLDTSTRSDCGTRRSLEQDFENSRTDEVDDDSRTDEDTCSEVSNDDDDGVGEIEQVADKVDDEKDVDCDGLSHNFGEGASNMEMDAITSGKNLTSTENRCIDSKSSIYQSPPSVTREKPQNEAWFQWTPDAKAMSTDMEMNNLKESDGFRESDDNGNGNGNDSNGVEGDIRIQEEALIDGDMITSVATASLMIRRNSNVIGSIRDTTSTTNTVEDTGNNPEDNTDLSSSALDALEALNEWDSQADISISSTSCSVSLSKNDTGSTRIDADNALKDIAKIDAGHIRGAPVGGSIDKCQGPNPNNEKCKVSIMQKNNNSASMQESTSSEATYVDSEIGDNPHTISSTNFYPDSMAPLHQPEKSTFNKGKFSQKARPNTSTNELLQNLQQGFQPSSGNNADACASFVHNHVYATMSSKQTEEEDTSDVLKDLQQGFSHNQGSHPDDDTYSSTTSPLISTNLEAKTKTSPSPKEGESNESENEETTFLLKNLQQGLDNDSIEVEEVHESPCPPGNHNSGRVEASDAAKLFSLEGSERSEIPIHRTDGDGEVMSKTGAQSDTTSQLSFGIVGQLKDTSAKCTIQNQLHYATSTKNSAGTQALDCQCDEIVQRSIGRKRKHTGDTSLSMTFEGAENVSGGNGNENDTDDLECSNDAFSNGANSSKENTFTNQSIVKEEEGTERRNNHEKRVVINFCDDEFIHNIRGEDSSTPNRLYDTSRLKGDSSTSNLVAISKNLDASSWNSSPSNYAKRRNLKESNKMNRGILKDLLSDKTKKIICREADYKDHGGGSDSNTANQGFVLNEKITSSTSKSQSITAAAKPEPVPDHIPSINLTNLSKNFIAPVWNYSPSTRKRKKLDEINNENFQQSRKKIKEESVIKSRTSKNSGRLSRASKKSKSKQLKMMPKRSKKYSTRDKATKIPDVIVVSSNRSKTREAKTKEAAKEREVEVLSDRLNIGRLLVNYRSTTRS